MVKLLHIDCMDYMKDIPDKHFDLAIVDPPYGIGSSKPTEKPCMVKQKNGNVLGITKPNYKHKDWDLAHPEIDYFTQLMRVSKHQIIWGCNYYNYDLSGGRIIWDKVNGYSDQYDGEVAFQSFNNRVEIVRYMWAGMMQGKLPSDKLIIAIEQQGNKKKNETRIHPTQKPVKLYEWLLYNYAKENDKILDTHLGSGSIAIACHNMGFDLVGCEIDKDYYNDALQRFNIHKAQLKLF